MACLTANISRVGEGLVTSVSRIGEGVVAGVSRIGEGLVARCSIVCTIAEITDYLEVTPIEVQWITDDIGVFFDVKSNVKWIITTD